MIVPFLRKQSNKQITKRKKERRKKKIHMLIMKILFFSLWMKQMLTFILSFDFLPKKVRIEWQDELTKY